MANSIRKLKEVMTRNIRTVGPDASLKEVASKMDEQDTGAIPVCESDEVVGIITDRDIVLRVFSNNLDPATARARDVMTPSVVSLNEDQDVDEAAKIMQAKQIRRLIVLDSEGSLTGIVSLGDLAVSGQRERSADVLEKISQSPEKKGAA